VSIGGGGGVIVILLWGLVPWVFVVLRITVDVACLDEPLACHISSLVVAWFVGHHHCCHCGHCGCGHHWWQRHQCGWSVASEGGGWLLCMVVVGREKLCIVGQAKSSVRVCQHPFWESSQRVGMYSIKYIYITKLLAQLVKHSCLTVWLCSQGCTFNSLLCDFFSII
jgi:hypothetical protein